MAQARALGAAVVSRPRRRRSYAVLLWRIAVGAGLLLFWQWAAGGLVSENYFAKPTTIALRLYQVFSTGIIWMHIQITLTEIVIGFLIGASTGMAAGFLLGNSEALSAVLEPYVMAFYGIPRIALAPIFIILLGIGIWSKVAVVIIQVFFMLFINAYAGVKNINQEYVQLARIMGAGSALIVRKVIVPSIMPFIMLGMRSAVPYAVIGAIVGEYIGASRGLGYYINYSFGTFDSAGGFAGIFILLAFIMAANALMQRVEQAAIRWRRTEEQVGE